VPLRFARRLLVNQDLPLPRIWSINEATGAVYSQVNFDVINSSFLLVLPNATSIEVSGFWMMVCLLCLCSYLSSGLNVQYENLKLTAIIYDDDNVLQGWSLCRTFQWCCWTMAQKSPSISAIITLVLVCVFPRSCSSEICGYVLCCLRVYLKWKHILSTLS
jgi:hypothetical protein